MPLSSTDADDDDDDGENDDSNDDLNKSKVFLKHLLASTFEHDSFSSTDNSNGSVDDCDKITTTKNI